MSRSSRRTAYWAVVLFLALGMGALAPGASAQRLGGILKKAEEVVKDGVGGGETSADVSALLKKINSDLRKAESLMFSGKTQESSDLLDGVAKDVEAVEKADPSNTQVKSLKSKYDKQRKDLDRRMPKTDAPAPAAAPEPAESGSAAAEALPSRVTEQLAELAKHLDDAEGLLAKGDAGQSDEARAKEARDHVDSAAGIMNEIQRSNGSQKVLRHPDVLAAEERRDAVQKKVDALEAAVTEGKAKDVAAAEEAEEAARAEEKATAAAWESRTIDKAQASKDWVALMELHDRYSGMGDSLSDKDYLNKNGAVRLQEWRAWKADFVPFWERFKATYGDDRYKVDDSFKDVPEPLGVRMTPAMMMNGLYGALDTAAREKEYVDELMRHGRDSYNRWKNFGVADPTKVELKFDYTERALNAFTIAKELDPGGAYDDFIAQAEAARKATYPEWVEVLKTLEWKGHNASFSGPGKPADLAAAALEFIKGVKEWTKPEYDDVHIPIAASLTGSSWEVSKTNVLNQPLQYSVNVTVAFEGKKDPNIVYVYEMVFYTKEELGVAKAPPFHYANSRQYAKYRMLKSKVPR